MSVKERLLEMKVDADIKLDDVAVNKEKLKKKALTKALQGRQMSAFLKKWRGSQRQAMERDGRSREELLQDLVPMVQAKSVNDPAAKVVADFVKFHEKLEAEEGKGLGL
jgi:hypothetical protein